VCSHSFPTRRSSDCRVTAGTFIGVSRQPVRCNLNAALLRTDAAELLVTDPRRRQVLRADLT